MLSKGSLESSKVTVSPAKVRLQVIAFTPFIPGVYKQNELVADKLCLAKRPGYESLKESRR